ncbi:MAG: hypothetical protein ABR888_08280 [Thermoplasmata archaeon]|jgi:hypothetical protein
MPLVSDPSSFSAAVLQDLLRSLREDLEATGELVQHPSGEVRDPASLATATELLRSTLAVLDLPGPRTPEVLVAEVNLTYSTMLSVIDLVKSHTDVPRVPRKRPPE